MGRVWPSPGAPWALSETGWMPPISVAFEIFAAAAAGGGGGGSETTITGCGAITAAAAAGGASTVVDSSVSQAGLNSEAASSASLSHAGRNSEASSSALSAFRAGPPPDPFADRFPRSCMVIASIVALEPGSHNAARRTCDWRVGRAQARNRPIFQADRRVPPLAGELALEDVVPFVGDTAHRIEEILELFVVEAGEAAKRTHVDLVLRGVDRE